MAMVIAGIALFYIAADAQKRSMADLKPLSMTAINRLAAAAGIRTPHTPANAAPNGGIALSNPEEKMPAGIGLRRSSPVLAADSTSGKHAPNSRG